MFCFASSLDIPETLIPFILTPDIISLLFIFINEKITDIIAKINIIIPKII